MELTELRKELGLKLKVKPRKDVVNFPTCITLGKALAIQFLNATEGKGISKASWITEAIIEKLGKEK